QERGTRKSFIHKGSFHEAVAPVLTVAQCFCLMPVLGIGGSSVRSLHFTRKSWRFWYSCLYLCSTTLDLMFSIRKVSHSGLDVRSVGESDSKSLMESFNIISCVDGPFLEPIVFHVSILIASSHFLNLANLWPGLMRHWEAVEKRLPRYGCHLERSHPARRIRMVAFLLLALSLMEHLLSIIAVVYYDFCPRRKDPVESYLHGTSLHLFEVFAYSNWLGWLGKLQNVLLTFGWSYMDIFLMIIGMGLSEMLARLNRSLKSNVRHVSSKKYPSISCHFIVSIWQPMPEEYWTWSRTLYRSIVELIREVDDAISGIMLISFGSNLYFICLQLLKSINTMPSSAHAVYFYYSLCFLLSRASMVLLLVSAINDQAREPLQLLRLIPSEAYHQPEVTRFAAELASDKVALTGAKFFNVTRRLFLAMAGTVATYELVLIQFHEDKKSWTCSVETFD
ncbi:hypothetical protein KR074_009135, partial [Drosophila pseudoananassae]